MSVSFEMRRQTHPGIKSGSKLNDAKKYLVWSGLIICCLMLNLGCMHGGRGLHQASGGHRAIISRGVIKNMTTVMLKEMELVHLPTNFITRVSAIYPKTDAEIGFRPATIRADIAVLSWVEKGQKMKV